MTLQLIFTYCVFMTFLASNVYGEAGDGKLTTPDIIRKNGYPCQVHKVTTEDGYILELHRIPYGRQRKSYAPGPPVILQHGLLGSSADWVLMGVEKAMAYLLADVGYDVWITNSRGNRYSKKHKKLDPDTHSQFWRFSFHHMGAYDLPASIDYILEQTKQMQLFFIGHSQGNSLAYICLSEHPEYNKKIRVVFSLAPVSFMAHMFHPFYRFLSAMDVFINTGAEFIGFNEFVPSADLFRKFQPPFCKDSSIFAGICTNIFFISFGFNRKEFDNDLFPDIFGHVPAGTSVDVLLHYAQEINSGRFSKYDYGIFRNMLEYHSPIPPEYKLENTQVPVYLFYASNDWLASTLDVEKLAEKLPNVLGKFLNDDNEWCHADYVYGKHARTKIYNVVVNLMKRH